MVVVERIFVFPLIVAFRNGDGTTGVRRPGIDDDDDDEITGDE